MTSTLEAPVKLEPLAPPVLVRVEVLPSGWSQYVVACGRYRAVLPACGRDECQPGGSMTECRIPLNGRGSKLAWNQHPTGGKNSVDAWLRHIKTHCHGWHDGRVADFARSMAKTYGSHKLWKVRRSSPTVRANEQWVAEQLGLTVEQYRDELAKAAA